MKKRRILIIAAAAACAVTLVVVGVIRGYFTEVEVKENKITIGNISINLTEGSFDPETTYPVVPGSVVEKAPKIANDGNRDEFVLMTVTVPKAQVTLLDESGSNKGNPKTGLDSIQQLFISGRDIDFTYHSGSDTGEGADGWVLLTSDTTGSDYDLYVFGYNKKMLPADETVTLFDKVQLKSFIAQGYERGLHKGALFCGGFE